MTQSHLDSSRPPSSRFKRFLKWGLLSVIVLALMGGTVFSLVMKIKFADFQPPMTPANVIVSPVTKYDFKDTIEAIGTITASESAIVTATITETVTAINAEEGQFVKKGTSIVNLNDDEAVATLNQASQSFYRYDKLVRDNLASPERRDQEKASYKLAKAQMDKRNITAPFDGFLGIRHVNVGDIVQPGTVITTIDSIDPIKLDFTVPEIFVAALQKDMAIEATTAAYPDSVFKGKIYVVNSRVDETTRSVMARAIMPNADYRLKPGMLMKVKIIRSVKPSLAIPESAVLAAGDKRSVFVVGADKKVVEKEIRTGMREPGLVEVMDGLAQGDKVIIEGQMKTGNGAEVNIVSEKYTVDTVREDAGFSIPRKQVALEKEFDISTPKKEK